MYIYIFIYIYVCLQKDAHESTDKLARAETFIRDVSEGSTIEILFVCFVEKGNVYWQTIFNK